MPTPHASTQHSSQTKLSSDHSTCPTAFLPLGPAQAVPSACILFISPNTTYP